MNISQLKMRSEKFDDDDDDDDDNNNNNNNNNNNVNHSFCNANPCYSRRTGSHVFVVIKCIPAQLVHLESQRLSTVLHMIRVT